MKLTNFISVSLFVCLVWPTCTNGKSKNDVDPAAVTHNSYGSYQTRPYNHVKWYVDGKSYMSDAADALDAAKEQIMIAGWWINPEIYLKRNPNLHEWRLDQILQRKARQNVTVHVLVWWEPKKLKQTQNSEYTMEHLHRLHPNIKVLRHGDNDKMPFWAHHEKLVIIDRKVAFVGGLDLAYGRWDDEHHKLFDMNQTKQSWPGKDYANFYIKDVLDPHHPEEENFDRSEFPRQPWHDIHAVVKGRAAEDVANHFMTRWNFAWPQCCSDVHKMNEYVLFSGKCGHKQQIHCNDHCGFLKMNCKPYDMFDVKETTALPTFFDSIDLPANVQVLHSLSKWSGGLENTERSIQNAYIDLIKKAQHYIYIENQFFISTFATENGKYVQNGITEALFYRILKAHKNHENFRVYVLLPLLPGFQRDSEEIAVMLQWTYRSISKGKRSLIENLRNSPVGDHLHKYIGFYSLRTWEMMEWKQPKMLKTQPIYIHSKTMIVDDRYTIIGSANINDRSQMGSRDSEVALYVEDIRFTDSIMNGQPYKSGEFAGKLRRQLMNEHLGQLDHENPEIDVTDPVSTNFFLAWNMTAINNTGIYEKAFPGLAPSDKIRTLEQWQATNKRIGRKRRDAQDQQDAEFRGIFNRFDNLTEEAQEIFQKLTHVISGSIHATPENVALLGKVRGYLVPFPTQFLNDEKLKKSQYSVFDKSIYV